MMDTLLTILILIAGIALIGAAIWAISMARFLYIFWQATKGDHNARNHR